MKIIIAAESDLKDIVRENNNISIYDFPENMDKEEIIPIISSKNFKVASYFSHMGAFHESLRSNDRELIASQVSKILECPVDFVSRNGKVLVSVNNKNKKNRFSKNQYIPELNKITNQMADTIFFNPIRTNRLIPLDEADKEEIGNYLFPVHSENSSPVILGYVVLEHMTRKTIDYLLPVMDYFQSSLSMTFWNSELNEYIDATRYISIIKQLLNGDIHDNVQIKRITEKYFPVKDSPLLLIVIQSSDMFIDLRQKDNVISEVFPFGAYFTFNTVSAVLLPYSEENLCDEKMQQLQNSLEKYNCTAGISEPIPMIDSDFKNYFERAHAAAITVNFLERKKRYMRYKEAALGHLAMNLTEVPHLSGIRKSLVDVNLIRMIELDAKKGSDYFRTLQAYWHFNHDTAKICDYLHLSKSTLFYKLNKIKEFLGQDINDYENVVQLSLGISILESMGLVTRDDYPDK